MLQCLRALLAAHTASSPALGNFVSAYAQVSHAASPWLSDSGATSTYANNSKASFYRALIETNPYLLDTMLLADPDEFARLRAVLAWLSDARDKYGHEGAFAQLVVPIDRAPLAHYLSEEAAEADRQALAFLLRSVWKESSQHPSPRNLHGRGFIGRYSLFVELAHRRGDEDKIHGSERGDEMSHLQHSEMHDAKGQRLDSSLHNASADVAVAVGTDDDVDTQQTSRRSTDDSGLGLPIIASS